MRDADITAGIFPSSHSIVVTDATKCDNPIVFVSAGFETLTGYTPKDVIGRNCRLLQHPSTDPTTLREIRDALRAGVPVRREMLNVRKDGTTFWNDVAIDPIFDAGGTLTGFIGVQYDCSAKHSALRACTDAETRLARIIDNVPGFVFQRRLRTDGTMSYSYMSGSLLRRLGIADDGRPIADQAWALLHPGDREALLQISIVSARTMTPLCAEFRFVTPSGRVHWFRAASAPCLQDNGDVLWDGIAIDVDLEKSTQSRLDYLTDHDSITGLLNRDALRARMLAATSTFAPERLALFALDLDQFQEVNEAWGQSFGDRLLRAIGARLKTATESVQGIVARVGGDEFAVLVRTPDDDGRVLAAAEDLRRRLAQPFWEAGQRAAVDACIGVAVFPPLSEVSQAGAAEEWASELMKRANLALSSAKQKGPGRCRLYSADLDDRQRNLAALRQSLQVAIDDRQFLLHYQPIANLQTGEVIGAEALVRWQHPEFGLQRPDIFIPLAESSGLIGPLGAWVTQRAMAQAQEWRRQGLRPPRMAINVSGVQLLLPGFLDGVRTALDNTGAEASDFEFELTEGTMIEASGQAQEALEYLRALGFGLAIDDFGTGHSTFRYLRDFRVDKIKIDRSFIRQLVIDSNDASIIRSIITLSHSLGVEVVAEGVATDMQRAFLAAEGCRVGQGSLFGMPVPARDFARSLRRRMPARSLLTAAQ